LQKESHIPGYKGFIKGIKAENLFASSFGRTTNASIEDKIKRGFDLGDRERYVSINQLTYNNDFSYKQAKVTNPFLEERSYVLAHAGLSQIAQTPRTFMSYQEALQHAKK